VLMNNDKLFRKESLERLSSPERLDQLMQVVNPRDWIPLTTFGVFVFAALIWSIFGRIPMTENTQGILIRPRKVVQFQSNIAGQLESLNVRQGQCVKKGEVLATINPSEMRQQLEQQRSKRVLLIAQAQDSVGLQRQRTSLEENTLVSERASIQQRLQTAQQLSPVIKEQDLRAILQQRQSLIERLRTAQALTPILRSKSSTAIAQQKLSVQQRLQDSEASVPIQKERWDRRKQLFAEGAIPKESILEVEQQYRQALQQVSELRAQLKQIDVQETEAQQQYLTNLNNISEVQAQLRESTVRETQAKQRYLDNLNAISQLQTQLQDINTKGKRLEQENLETSNNKLNEIKEVERNIAQLQQRLNENSKIVSTNDGCILEVTANAGQIVNPGTGIGTINIGGDSSQMVAVSYFSVGNGKKIKPGMQIQITPDMVKRERFGGIVGKVVSVSPFPVTSQGAALVLGNQELANKLIANEPKIEVTAELELDKSTPSGYRWSSSGGPKLQISTGTTTTNRVQVEKQAPITFMLPIFKEWTGFN
jgi:HlyD family secretion protein